MDEVTGARPARSWVTWLVDVAVAGFAMALTVPLVREAAAVAGAPVAFAVANGGVHSGVLVLRRVAPVPVMGVIGATAMVHAALGIPLAFLGPPALVGLHTVAVRRDRRVSFAALGAAVLVLVAGSLATTATPAWDSIALYAVLLGAAWWLGDTVRRRQLEAALHADRAAQLQRARLELARHAVTEERLRIARELHDVIMHSLTAVIVHAGTARLSLDRDPQTARTALRTIDRTTRGALGELRQLLGVLRDPEGTGPAPLAPSPRLERLADLVAESVDAGLAVDVDVAGDLRRLPPGLDVTAYRIVQEALTNTRRHARARRATVRVDVTASALALEVEDDGHAPAASTTEGLGLVGMRERVAIYGGELDAGPAPGGGFRVRARLPLPEEAG